MHAQRRSSPPAGEAAPLFLKTGSYETRAFLLRSFRREGKAGADISINLAGMSVKSA